MKKLKVIPDNIVENKQDKWYFEGKPIDEETIELLASESEMFKKSMLYKMWQGYLRTETITSIIKDSKDFRDVENGKALLIALDKLDNMMVNLIKQHTIIVKNKQQIYNINIWQMEQQEQCKQRVHILNQEKKDLLLKL